MMFEGRASFTSERWLTKFAVKIGKLHAKYCRAVSLRERGLKTFFTQIEFVAMQDSTLQYYLNRMV
jgi:hypothetical protein